MCGIAGFSNFHLNFREEPGKWYPILQNMNKVQKHRGPDADGVFLSRCCGLSHVRLSILDPQGGLQPMTRQLENHCCTICFNGEIYNMPALKKELEEEGMEFSTACDTEVILAGYLFHGREYVKRLNGIFAFCIWDESRRLLTLFRDRLGVKPLFYTQLGTLLYFPQKSRDCFNFQAWSPFWTKKDCAKFSALVRPSPTAREFFKIFRSFCPDIIWNLMATGFVRSPTGVWKAILMRIPGKGLWKKPVF